MPNIVRDTFHGGLIGREYQYKSGVEFYDRSLIAANNVLCDPYGQVTRRPPLVNIGALPSITIDSTVFYPKDARAFDFVFSITERYLAIFVTYEADGEDDVTRIVVKDSSGVEKAALSTTYTQLAVLELDTHHSNDQMWIVHNDFIPGELKRISDTEWEYGGAEINGGPFLDENEDGYVTMNVGLSGWRSDVNYSAGDIVLPASSDTGTLRWIGTAYSIKEEATVLADDPTSATYGAASTWTVKNGSGDYYVDDLNWNYRKSVYVTGDGYLAYTQLFPYTYLQVDKAFAALLSVGDTISILSDFVEEGGQDTFSAQATVAELLTGTTYDYIKVDLGWSGNTTFYGYRDRPGVPTPDMPEDAKPGWQSIADGFFGGDVSELNGENLMYGKSPYGGAFITETSGNIAKGVGSATAYRALVANINTAVTDTATWEVVADPEESPLVLIECVGDRPFTSEDVSRIMYVDKGEDFAQSDEYTAAQEGTAFSAIGRVQLKTSGTWDGEMALMISKNAGATWEKEKNLYNSNNDEISIIEIEIDQRDILVRVDAIRMTSGTCRWIVSFPDGYSSIYTIIKYIDANGVLARNTSGTNTFFQSSKWALGSFGGANGYPGAVTEHENRLIYSGSIGEPFKQWGSVVNKFWNFALGTFASSAIIFQARADSSTRIAWTESKEHLFYGTDYGEYTAENLNLSTTLSASNPPRVKRHTTEGSSRIGAHMVGNSLVYVSADKKKSKMLRFDALERDGYRSYDLNIHNPKLTGTASVVGMCLQRTPYPIVWYWLDDGTALSLTINQEANVFAWSRHSTLNGLIKSLCVLPDENGIDEIYAVVERDNKYGQMTDIDASPSINDFEVAYIETDYQLYGHLFTQVREITEDGGITPEVVPSFAISLIGGKYTMVDYQTTNGKYESDTLDGIWTAVAGSGQTGTFEGEFPSFFIEKLDYTEDTYTDGLGWGLNNNLLTSEFEPTPLSRGPNFLDGNQKFRSARILVYVNESNGGQVSIDGGNTWEDIDYGKLTADANGLYTGFAEVRTQSGWVDFASVKVRTTGTDALNVTALKMPIDRGER